MTDLISQAINLSALKTYAAIVLDESGSMMGAYRETVNGFNEQVQAIKEGAQDVQTLVSLVKFGSTVKPVFINVPSDQVNELTQDDYRPGGMTALYDAVGYIIDKLSEQPDINDENVSVLISIITDGEENHSTEYTSAILSSKIKELQDTNRWTFTYMGSDVDLAEEVTQNLGLNRGNVTVFDASNAQGYASAYTANTGSIGSYMSARMVGTTAVNNFYAASTVTNQEDDHNDGS